MAEKALRGTRDGGYDIAPRWLAMEVFTPFWDNRFGWWLARIGIRWRSKDTTFGQMISDD